MLVYFLGDKSRVTVLKNCMDVVCVLGDKACVIELINCMNSCLFSW